VSDYRIEWFDKEADLDGVMNVDRESFAAPWTREMYEQELLHTGQSFIAVLRTPAHPVAGYCSYRLVLDETQINNVAVRADCRGRGYGRALVEFTLAHGRTLGSSVAMLEVRRSNEVARRLYDGLGFLEVAVRSGYYANPAEDALVLVRHVRFLESNPTA
jgi:ribosomal-protein-alanine N-acetyltransferase